MASNYRKIGLELIGDLPWGTHFCHFYRTKEDLIEILVPYFKAGLESDELCMWVCSEPLNVEEAKTSLSKTVRNLDDYIKKGQLEILDYSEWYMKSGKLRTDKALQGWVEEEKLALEKGFEGLRISGNTFWLESKDWKDYSEYEAAVESVIRNYRMIAICSYSLDKTEVSELMDVVKHHQFVLIKREDDWAIVENLERKRMEDVLRESEERYRTIFEQAADSIVLIDAETGEPVEFNDRAHENLGYSREEFKKLKIPDFEVIESAEDVTNHIAKIVNEGSDVFETQHRTKDDEIRDIRVSSRAICIGGRNFVQSIWRDVTERKQAMGALQESEEKLQRILESVNDGITVTDLNGVITDVNEKTLQLSKSSSKSDLIGKNAFESIVPYDRERALEDMQELIKRGSVGTEEYTLTRADGSEYPAEISASVLNDAAGNLVGFVSIIRDITERKQAEEALKESEERYRALVNLGGGVGEAIIMLQDTEQGEGVHTFVSDEWPRITGYSRKELLGMSFFDLLQPEHRKASLERYKRRMGGEAIPGLYEMSITRKDGTEVPVELTSAYTTYKGQRANVAFIRDITERRQAEEREKGLQQELNRTSRLASVGELAAGVAHELNNPLTGILGFSERLLRKSSDEKISRDLDKIYSEAMRAARVVQNLRTFARRREPSKEYSNVNDIVQKALELRAYELKTGNIKVVTDLTPRFLWVLVDFYQIQEVFLNIILNAEQAMTEANVGGKLSIKTEEIEGYIRISFSDDGPGIPADQLDKVFDPFFTTRGETGGTGLGLSVCHGIVTEHGGKIYAKSKSWKGTTFFVELPLVTEGEVNISPNTG